MHSWMASLVWVVAFLTIGSPFNTHHRLTSFPVKRQVIEEGADLTLKCNTDLKTVNWTFSDPEGVEELDNKGSEITLTNFHESWAGNFSCWDGDKLLDNVYVFQAETPDSSTPKLRCWAETYNCSFKCKWPEDDTTYTAVRLRNGRNGEWVSLSEGLHTVRHASGSEEKIDITLEAINDKKYLQIKESFFLHEIIQPPVPKYNVLKTDPSLEVVVFPADNWSKPTSYYPLEYQIEYEKKDNGKKVLQPCCKDTTKDCWSVSSVKCEVDARVNRFRIRSRDPLVNSDWESQQWTAWHIVGKKRRQGGRKCGEGTKRKGRSGGKKRKGGKHKSTARSS